jgi:hypothetical protein
MTEEVKTEESIVGNITDLIKDTIKEQAGQFINKIIEALKEKLTAEGIEFSDQIQTIIKELIEKLMTDTTESVGTKVESFLKDKKDQWAALAAEDPDEARRKLRTFWVGISGVCLVAGGVIGFFLDKFI